MEEKLEHTLHERVAQLARERGELDTVEVFRALLEIGRITEQQGHVPSIEIWVERGWLPRPVLEVLIRSKLLDPVPEEPEDALDPGIAPSTPVPGTTHTLPNALGVDSRELELPPEFPDEFEESELNTEDLTESTDEALFEEILGSAATQTLMTMPELRAISASIPVATQGASGMRSGTA